MKLYQQCPSLKRRKHHPSTWSPCARKKRWIRTRQASKLKREQSNVTGAEHDDVSTITTLGNFGCFTARDRMLASENERSAISRKHTSGVASSLSSPKDNGTRFTKSKGSPICVDVTPLQVEFLEKDLHKILRRLDIMEDWRNKIEVADVARQIGDPVQASLVLVLLKESYVMMVKRLHKENMDQNLVKGGFLGNVHVLAETAVPATIIRPIKIVVRLRVRCRNKLLVNFHRYQYRATGIIHYRGISHDSSTREAKPSGRYELDRFAATLERQRKWLVSNRRLIDRASTARYGRDGNNRKYRGRQALQREQQSFVPFSQNQRQNVQGSHPRDT
ncbi:hypothetical protein DBV15_12198, partial [Temnothorax longispinosus]